MNLPESVRKRFSQDPEAVISGCLIAVFLLLVLVPLTIEGLSSFGGDLGSFYGTAYHGSPTEFVVSNSIPYKSGQLVAYSGNESHAAILAYVENGATQWASELATGDDPALRVSKIVEMKVHYGLFRDKIDFFATGTSEPGWAYIWRFGKEPTFYLKMF